MYYLNYFFISSIIGHLYETILFKILNEKGSSGFLYGYWTPVYGIGVVLILLISKYIFKSLKINRFLEVLIFAIVIFIVLTLIEYIGGHILHFIFHKDFWNYSLLKYNFGKYICLNVSILWVVLSLIFLYLIKPWMDIIILKIPSGITIILIVLFVIDLVCTIFIKNKLV